MRFGEALCHSAALAYLTLVFDTQARLPPAFQYASAHFHRVMTTRVPAPTVD